ncbi:hypothetical protein [Actinomadura roseirufa]|uniref:hypothetical protein n=1 Tax=Actinomadura roseirufa TaxID=2094049 RepID=UPI0010413F8A|nr:hypothetical protein [Actinomadura roseirufa]
MSKDHEAEGADPNERLDGIEHPDGYGRLGALMSRLQIYGLKTVLQRGGLIVINPNLPGCCEGAPQPADTITCRPREDDGERLWFFTVRREAPCHIPGSAGRNLEGVPGSDDLPGFER